MNETDKIINDEQKIEDLINNEGWKLAKKKLVDKLIELDSIAAMPKTATSTEIVKEMKIREGVISIIMEWLKELEGTANKSKFNKKQFQQIRKETIIQYYE